MRLDMDQIKCANGVKNILEITDDLFEKDKVTSMYECYRNFEDYRRPPGTTISDFVNEFERRLNKTKEYQIQMSENLLAFRLLKCSNISTNHEQLVRATITQWTYPEMKSQLKAIFGDSSIDDHCEINQSEACAKDVFHDEEALYGRYKPSRGNLSNNYYRGNRGSNPRGNKFNPNNNVNNRGRGRGSNPTDQYGRITTCSNWVKQCPDANTSHTFETFT